MKNFILYLEFPYAGLYASYSTHAQRHLRRAEKKDLTFVDGIALHEYLDFKTYNQSEEIYGKCLPNFRKLASYILYEGKGSLMGVYNRSNELCAAGFFYSTKNGLFISMGLAVRQDGKQVPCIF
jgi:hypothetical protein